MSTQKKKIPLVSTKGRKKLFNISIERDFLVRRIYVICGNRNNTWKYIATILSCLGW